MKRDNLGLRCSWGCGKFAGSGRKFLPSTEYVKLKKIVHDRVYFIKRIIHFIIEVVLNIGFLNILYKKQKDIL